MTIMQHDATDSESTSQPPATRPQSTRMPFEGGLIPAAPAESGSVPAFIVTLGLALPATLEDIQEAYRQRVKTAHPDVGGDPEEFKHLEQAYQQALEYARFRSGRTRWLAAQVERYVAHEGLLREIARRGGHAETEGITWMDQSIGHDFSQLLEQIVSLSLTGPQVDDETIDWLAEHRDHLVKLHSIDLSGSQISDRGMVRLMAFPALRHITARDTAITPDGLQVMDSLPNLETLDIVGMELRWLSGWRLRHTHPTVKILT